MSSPPWWRPDRLQARLPALRARTAIRRAIADWFEAEGFLEVETPALQYSPGLEPHLSAFRTELQSPGRAGSLGALYLHTSPEFAMKKLLAGGLDRIWQIAPVFRNAERSAAHHPEFRMLEWYRVHAGYETLMDDTIALLRATQGAAGGVPLRAGPDTCDAFAPCTRISVEAAVERATGIALRPLLQDDPLDPPSEPLRRAARAAGMRVGDDDRFDDIVLRILGERVEPTLGFGAPAILTDYPVCMAALARPKPGDPIFAERFEVYICGVELANAFGELTDPVEQLRRFEADMAVKQVLYGERYPIDSDFLEALAHMPPASGIALGFDRLVMLATGAARIEDVLWAEVPVAGSPG